MNPTPLLHLAFTCSLVSTEVVDTELSAGSFLGKKFIHELPSPSRQQMGEQATPSMGSRSSVLKDKDTAVQCYSKGDKPGF